MTGFEPQISGIGSGRSANGATTTAKLWGLFLQNGPNPASFVYFRPFLNTIRIIVKILLYKSIDGVLGIQTQVRRMVREDKSTEL